ncbi:hypothetical protein [Streptomyces sp. NPDC058486]|uniref:hypothetical protein n=1 Tax=unclassified Streptomyces TaxID=2593676 RepID=UPI003662FC92
MDEEIIPKEWHEKGRNEAFDRFDDLSYFIRRGAVHPFLFVPKVLMITGDLWHERRWRRRLPGAGPGADED